MSTELSNAPFYKCLKFKGSAEIEDPLLTIPLRLIKRPLQKFLKFSLMTVGLLQAPHR
ncbi:hypothetical protein AXF42_Ash008923 [Apostasia shenzhenica]|uniref:Uncharacterized protein n=1 Tax=Apostasia shenzhenica TaxID=1088818 RepID=A0A2I0AT17_9ASPA|nr:hypothetical protein AXF42_Ash008923 [Apostasia shenzhenica]